MTAGAPMILFIVGGSVGLSNFMQTHYDLKDKASNTQTTRKFDLEEEHASMMKSLDIENFSLSRIPRPDELDAAAALRKEAKEKKKKWSPKKEYTERPVDDKVAKPLGSKAIEDGIPETSSQKGWMW